MTLHLEIHDNELGWRDAGTVTLSPSGSVQLEYDLDYACEYFGQRDERALSLAIPIDTRPYDLPGPAFLLDLIPQGDQLKRLLARHGIAREDAYADILREIPLAAPGNIRVREPWTDMDARRGDYDHRGFTQADIVQYRQDFAHYMETHGAPIGGTNGAGGGSPKFLLRQDKEGYFHADGALDDTRTQTAFLVKFPYTDSRNSCLLARTEKAYYDVLRKLPLITGDALEIVDDVLFIRRFDRQIHELGRVFYYGLESLYGAQGISQYGQRLLHETNILHIAQCSSDPCSDIVEYLKRDIINQALANPDNHGRNTSWLKKNGSVRLSPVYDVTAMRFFQADFIVQMTDWHQDHQDFRKRLNWLVTAAGIPPERLRSELQTLKEALENLDFWLRDAGVPDEIFTQTTADRDRVRRMLETPL